MNELEKSRREIDEIDRSLAQLFCRRMKSVKDVGLYKSAHGLPVFDEGREAQVLERAAGRVDDPLLRSYYVLFVRDMMEIAKKYGQESSGGFVNAILAKIMKSGE